MEDLSPFGGTPVIMKYLFKFGFLHGDCLTVTGRTLEENIQGFPDPEIDEMFFNQKVVYPLNSPIKKNGHIVILYGNLAPSGAVAKITGKEGFIFSGFSRTFNSEEEANRAILNREIHVGDVVVIRYVGPKGGPGMPEMLKPTSCIVGVGLGKDVALITDGRFSGGSEILIKSLLDEKVNYVFGYPGGTIMPVYDVMHFMREKYINHILNRHEQGAIHAAQGYSKVSGKVGVCLTSSGPGATNLVTGLSDAMVDSSPIVCISGQVSSSFIGTDAFQEINIIDISLSVTKWNVQVPYAEYIYPTIRKAFYISKIGRPGPVLVDLTKNAQFQRIHFYGGPYGFEKYKKEIIYINKIKKAVELINSATKPFIIFGQGVILANAEEELKKFVEKTGIPFACTLLGLGALDSEHPLFMGMLGMHGNYAPNVLTNKCDVLISIGMRFDDRVTGNINGYTQKASIIHLDIDPCEIDKNIPCILQILGDCKITLPKFTSLVKKKSHGEWLKNFLYLKNKEEKIVLKNDLYPNPKKFTMGEVIHKINQYKKNNALLVTDVGQHQMIASRYFNFSPKRSQVTSGGIGTMGFALPASIGAKIGGKKNRQVI